ncbi:2-oxoglutarate dehydrogenase, E2 component, dihydrolipoamide succinyltransferase [Nocardioides jishulii]|uniref:Dihydrolipoamide acetyltransferase component of pyruvate dehydrogenase complex n=1 Tax=Nocardioides jishulii TaxID=2575440 RepID=A0A4U2YP11_9ACTN|nr:2-oxoglutarate dehydrogenase, E2 component, dihydrolipoamide succinyltransferase [Nocardioides jishulii]QCX27787.1 2-oxoglutarate dehydrogenase, E2 component, dihydrolipoamide succinyltransferase [Nocardioides jishulii]TKI62594.1 2-oxoglutarate dehydrogenase, E2 component, dihydrolipoamide succinyltransferase [Nocardioides jishulii]
MASEVTLPALGESVTEGTVTRWLKQVGDTVAVDEPLLEVSTDKVDTEIPSPIAGTLLEIRANEDDTVEVGAVLAVIGEEGEGGASAEAPAEEAPAQEAPAAEAPAEEAPAEEAPAEEAPAAEAPAAEAPAADAGDATSVTLPALGESVTEGTVTRWLKQVGDTVAVDEPLLEVSTDKVDTEIPSPVAGTLLEIKVAEDETVEVGAELALVGSGSPAAAPAEPAKPAAPAQPAAEEKPAPAEEKPAAPAAEEKPAAPAKAEEKPAAPAQAAAPAEAKPSREDDQSAYVTPLVRKLAADNGVDLTTLTGTGVGGRIRKQDVLDAAAAAKAPAAPAAEAAPAASAPSAPSAPAVSPLRGRTEPLTRLRKVIAQRMVESLQTAAQLTTVVEVDVTDIARQRDAIKADFLAREGVKLSFMPFFAKAAIDSLKAHPVLNAQIDIDKGEVTYFDKENLAIAVDSEKGLLTPVIKDAGDLSVAGLARKIADVADRTRNNKIGPDELSGGTFTLTNTGSRGALFDTPILNQPQVAILGTGSVVKRPVVITDPKLGETIAVRQMVYLALTYDHRLVDGADAARFLSDVKQRLEAGQFDI